MRSMSQGQCELLRELASNAQYQFLISLKLIICVIGAIGACYQWRKQGVRFLVHNNTKIIFNFFYALNAILAMFFALVYIFELFRLRYNCFIINFRTVLLLKGNSLCVVVSTHFVLSIISFERLYSSLYPSHFEKHSSKRLANVLSVTAIVLSCTTTMYLLSNGFTLFGNLHVAILEEKINENSENYQKFTLLGVIANAFSQVIVVIDLYLNFIRKPPTLNPSLSVSYQRLENRRVIGIILPIEITESLLSLVTSSALTWQDQLVDVSNPISRIFVAEILNMPMFFPLILAVIIELRVARRSQAPLVKTANGADYFDNLRRAWN